MAIFPVNGFSLLKLLLIMSLGIYSCNAFAQDLEDITLTITFGSEPTDYDATKAPLKFNKKFALSMQIDDGNSSIYDYGFPVFEGGQVGSTTYPGMNFSDGCNNQRSFKMTSAIFIFSGVGTDLHNDPSSNFITWQQLDTLYQNHWGIANHGVDSEALDIPEFIDYSIARNKSYVRRKMYSSTPGGVVTRVFVNPNGNSNWTLPALEMDNICALNENNAGPMGDYGANVNDPTINWATNKYSLFRVNTGNRDIPDLIDSLASFSSDGANYWCPIYTHSVYDDYAFADFVDDFNYISNKYGSNGTDEILMATDEEILDYLIVRDAIALAGSLSGNKLTLTFSGNLPDDLLYYASSIVVNSDATITDIAIEGTENFSVSNVGDTSALINFSWDGHVVPPAETLATAYTSTAVATQTEYDALIAMDYVSVLEYGDTKYDLVNQLCSIAGVEYDEGFCKSGYPDFMLITGDSIISVGEETTLTATGFMESYSWSSGQTTQSITVSPVTNSTYWVDAVTKYGTNVSDDITVTVNDSYIIGHSPLTVNHIIGQPDSLWVELEAGATSLWSTGETLNYIMVDPDVSTTYHLDVLFNGNIVNQLDFDVFVGNAIEFTFDSICFGDITTLINTSSVNDTITKVIWDLDGDTQFDDAEGDTVEYVFGSSGNHLVGMRVYFKTDPMDVVYNAVPTGDRPNVNFEHENTCQGSTTLFYDHSTVHVGVPDRWFWRFGDGKTDNFQNTSNYYLNSGIFDVMLIVWSSSGCKDSLQKTVQIFNSPIIELKTANDSIVGYNDTVYFPKGGTVTISISDFTSYDSVIWFDDSRAESVIIAEEGSFHVDAYQNGCGAKQHFNTSWGSSPQPSGNDIMNLFTPNADGFNDFWIVNDPGIVAPFKAIVYNRSGKQVYSNNNYQNTWDGQYNGNPLPQATYYYIIEDASGHFFKGSVTIIR